ncbi:MAG: nucleotidyltransferase domain-containing protein [Nanoarchaeota archaeon]
MARKNSRKKQKQSQVLPEKKLRKPGFEKEKPEEQNRQLPSLQLKTEHDIAMDFAVKVYKRFDKFIKSVVLFGSVAKEEAVAGSDIDIVIIIDDVSVRLDEEIVAWYREELEKLLRKNPYQQSLHINTTKLSTWWEDLMRGDPTIINVIRYGEAMLDYGGFFEPLKRLLLEGKMRPSPEAIYVNLQRAPMHLTRSKSSQLGAVEGLYWAMVDSAHAALIAANVLPPSPEHLAVDLRETFVAKGKLKMKYVQWYRDVLMLHKKIQHGEIKDLKGIEIDAWEDRTKEFVDVMTRLVRDLVGLE